MSYIYSWDRTPMRGTISTVEASAAASAGDAYRPRGFERADGPVLATVPSFQVEVGVTGARAASFHKHLPRPGLGYRHLAKLGWLLPGDKLECSHARLLSR